MVTETRYDTDLPNIDIADHLALILLSGHWQRRNHIVKMRRLFTEAQGPQILR